MILSIAEYFPSTLLEYIAMFFSTVAVIMFIISATLKSKNKVIFNQSIAHIFLMFSESVTGAWSSVVQEVISLIRNIFVYFKKNTKVVNIILVTTGLVIGIYANLFTTNFFTPWKGLNLGKWYGYLPVIANFEYSIVLMIKNLDIKWLKISFACSNFLWGISFLLTGKSLIISGILNIVTGVVAISSFISMCRNKNIEEAN